MFHSFLLAVAQADRLAELIQGSRELRTFSAVLELTTTPDSGKTRFRIDFAAPSRVRVDRTLGTTVSSIWCVDGVLVTTSNEGGKALHGRADSAAAFAATAPLEAKLINAFPLAPARGAVASAVGMAWNFDAKTQKPNYSIESQLREESATPLGWLQTLQHKGALAREDGELLRFESDPHFRIAVLASNGFLREFSSVSPGGELRIALASLELNQAVDPARFAIPEASPAALDVSANLSRGLLRLAESNLRRRIYEAIAGGEPPAAWDDASVARISSVVTAFYEHTLPAMLDMWFEKNRKIQGGVSARLRGMRTGGKSSEEVEQARQREHGYLTRELDKLENEFRTRLALPGSGRPLPRAPELLAQELWILSDVFRVRVREPLLEGFERATRE